MKQTCKLYKQIRYRYIFAFILIALLAIGAFINLYYSISSQYIYSELINTSGKQRMLSQRITLFCQQLINQKSQISQKELESAIRTMQDDHDYLLSQIPSEEIRAMYYDGDDGVDKQVQVFLDTAREFQNNHSQTGFEHLFDLSQQLLPLLDSMVRQYQVEDESRTIMIKNIEIWILLITLLTLVLEALFIFKPSLEELAQNTKKETAYLSSVKNAAITDMMRSIAHNWRQPLTVILLIAENMADRIHFMKVPDEDKNALEQDVAKIIKEANTVSTSITILGKLYNPQDTKEKAVINVYDKLALTKAFFQSNQNISIQISVEEEKLATIYGDPDELSQCLIALVQNAVDSITRYQKREEGFKGEIQLRMRVSDQKVWIFVIDNGPGISEEIFDRIFEPYTTTEFQKSFKGISLFLVKSIIEQHFQGEISVNSEPGLTEFCIEIPCYVNQNKTWLTTVD